MKNPFLIKTFIFITLSFISLAIFGCENTKLVPTKNNIHFRQGYFGDPPNSYKFKDVPSDIGYLIEIPWDQIHKDVANELLDKIEIEYRIYSSVYEAEMAMVEQLEMSNLLMKNTIDYPLTNGEIGNNCWEVLKSGAIGFTRNNVLLFVLHNGTGSINADEIENIARTVDDALKNSEKVTDSSLVPVPKINSVEIISHLPKTWDDTVTIKINATDSNSKKLFYRKLAAPFGSASENGILTVKVRKPVDETGDPTKANVKIWVWNEDYFVYLLEKEIPFGK